MKKSLLFTIAILCMISSVFAKKTDIETAKKVGTNFFYERLSQHHQANYPQLSVKEVFSEKYSGKTVYYVMNFRDNGFVVVASDDVVTPVLAYSFEGNYSEENHPPQFDSWMELYAKQIDNCIQKNISATAQIRESWTHLNTSDPEKLSRSPLPDVAPLEISTWDQGSFYNALCPADPAGPDGKVWAGCVATAMSQIMYYYRYPAQGLGSNCYTPYGYAQQCADFGNTTYRWNEMMNSLNFHDTAVARLIWHAGVSVDMMYSASGSGAYSEDAVNAFINNFRYSPDAHLVARDDYPLNGDEYPAILRDNLDHKRPMYYDGYGTGGHAFNVDGYQGTDYFHFNWGWSGSCNGYYYLDNLNPGGDNFDNGQRAMVNLYPDTLTNTYPTYCTGQTVLTALSGTFEDGSGPKNYQNNANASWLIHPQSNSDSVTAIDIDFNRFSTEAGNDVVKIYKGSTTSDSLVGTYSGTTLPPSLRIPGNRVLVTFSSNGSITGDGWFITYTSETMNWCLGTHYSYDQQGEISDGSLNFNYKNNSNCRWVIEPDGGGAVSLSFNSFSTEAGKDLVRIIDLGTGQELAEYSGSFTDSNLPSPVTAPSGKMFIIFLTNSSNTYSGWSATYFTYPVGTQEHGYLNNAQVYPNPVTARLNLKFFNTTSQRLHVEIFTSEGRTVHTENFDLPAGADTKTIGVSGLSRGIYILRLTEDTETVTKKIVIQ